MYTYAQAETILARLYGADEQAQRNAFRGRLKHLKRLGIPLDVSPGRGKKVLYTREHIFQWALCLELAEFGVDPTLISRFITELWRHFHLIISWILSKPDIGDDIIYTINPAVMSKSWAYNEISNKFRDQFPDFLDFKPIQIFEAEYLAKGLRDTCRRVMLINVSEVIRLIDAESRALGVEPEVSAKHAQRIGDSIVEIK